MVIVRRLLWLALFVVVLVAGWKFANANADEVRLDYLVGQWSGLTLWVLVVATFALGAAAGVAVCLIEMARLGLLARRYRKALGRLEAELQGLRSLPLGSDPAGAPGPAPDAPTTPGRPGRGA